MFGYLWEDTYGKVVVYAFDTLGFPFLNPLYVMFFGNGIGLISRAKGYLWRQVPVYLAGFILVTN